MDNQIETDMTLWYFADPMCSWCWGFSPVLGQIKEVYGDKIKIALMLGGLRPGTREPVTPEFRQETLHHWKSVQKVTGQVFDFSDPMPEGFVYDTEPASRAVVAVSDIHPEYTLAYFEEVQKAFYTRQQDVTDVTVLTELAGIFSIGPRDFLNHFQDEQAVQKTQQHFQYTRQIGVRGFPALVISTGKSFKMLANGYRSFQDINRELEDWLQQGSQRDS